MEKPDPDQHFELRYFYMEPLGINLETKLFLVKFLEVISFSMIDSFAWLGLNKPKTIYRESSF